MSSLKLNSSGGGSVTLTPASTASNLTATVPAVADTLAVQGQLGLRNKIINGAMMIDQRNAGASVTQTTTGIYTLDRWKTYGAVTSKFTVQQNAGSVTPPVGFINYLGVTSSSSYSVGSTDEFDLYQPIEGLNISDLAWGTASAKTATLSFQVYSSLTGTFGGSIRNSATNRSYPFSYTISSANTWTSISIVIAGDTTGTWLTTNGIGMLLTFSMGAGSTLSGAAGSWSGNNYTSATGATSVVGTNGATFYITGVQLEKGATATPFENRMYGTELALCQRYLPFFSATGAGEFCSGLVLSGGTSALATFPFLVTPRVAPTGVSVSGTLKVRQTSGASTNATGVSFDNANFVAGSVVLSGMTGITAGNSAPTGYASGTVTVQFTGCEL